MSWEQVVGPPATVIAALVGWLGYKASQKRDAQSAQSGIMSEDRAGVNQKLEILNSIIDTLQEEREDVRVQLRELSSRFAGAEKDTSEFLGELKKCREHVEVITKERDALVTEVARLHSIYDPPSEAR